MARWYVGKQPDGAREVFSSVRKPTEASHGHRYRIVEGPFRSKGGAVEFAEVWNRVIGLRSRARGGRRRSGPRSRPGARWRSVAE